MLGPMKQPSGTVGIESCHRRAWVAAFFTALVITIFLAFFGSADVEESANTSYSIAAHHQTRDSGTADAGQHVVLGVPVYDTLQGKVIACGIKQHGHRALLGGCESSSIGATTVSFERLFLQCPDCGSASERFSRGHRT
ncbi:MAG: hypothetical protein RL072_1226 [Actinomycetota bacterium]|jgi:hypothetical protein